MADIFCYSFVEDEPSAFVAKVLVANRNSHKHDQLLFVDGFPKIMGGYSRIKSKCPSFLSMAKGGLYTLVIVDLDMRECAAGLIRDWFKISIRNKIAIPKEVMFRIAVREIESWILADRDAWAAYIGIPATNFLSDPDSIPDPKKHLLDVVQRKGRKKLHNEMLPKGVASIGPRYNEVLCEFIETEWSPKRAASASPSLKSAIEALLRI